MKTKLLIIVTLLGISILSCETTRENTAEQLLSSPKMEEEIYTAILSDSAYLSKFMDKLMGNDNGKQMMMSNRKMVKMMCMSPNLDSLLIADQEMMENVSSSMFNFMRADSMVCDKTCTRILNDAYLKARFINRANQMEEKTNSK